MGEEVETQKVRALDVVPGEWAIWCTIEGCKPFANDICAQKWTDDGQHIWFMLELHNFIKAAPDDLLDLMPYESRYDTVERREKRRVDHATFVDARPNTLRCHACGQPAPSSGKGGGT